MLLWLALYPLPAALTDSYHAMRSSLGLPVLAMLSALGIVVAREYVPRRGRVYASIGVAVAVALHAVAYGHTYLTRYADQSALRW